MIVYPAIDLRAGKVVRLRKGDPAQQLTFSGDPLSTAKQWIDQGAAWIHMVNLDGAFDNVNQNGKILEAVAKLDVKVQFGGGLRDLDALRKASDSGADRMVIGTLAIKNPEIIAQAVERFGAEAICVALDVKDGKVATHGWTQLSEHSPLAWGRFMRRQGIKHALYTDVRRDGSLAGVNIDDTIALGQQTGLKIIASGGLSQLTQIEELAKSQVVAGAVIGMALYQNKISLSAALQAARGARGE